MVDQTKIKQSHISWFRWGWRAGLLVLLILIVSVVVPIVQNGRAIQRLKTIDNISVTTEPGFLLGSLPSSWQGWLFDTLGRERLVPFQTTILII